MWLYFFSLYLVQLSSEGLALTFPAGGHPKSGLAHECKAGPAELWGSLATFSPQGTRAMQITWHFNPDVLE